MKIVDLTRKFAYNSLLLADPNTRLNPDQVREFYAMQYPELTNAVVEGPVTKGSVSTYTFTKAVGSKGRKPVSKKTTRDILLAAIQNPRAEMPQSKNPVTGAILEVCNNKLGVRLSPPSGAYRIFG